MNPSWGQSGLFSISTGLLILAVGLIAKKKHRNVQSAGFLLATGMSLGPLLLILLDPAAQAIGFRVNLLQIVLGEGRATLWRAAAVATFYLVNDIFA